MDRAIGIDLGTTYTLIATIENGRAKIIPNAEGYRLTLSVVSFTRDGKILVGPLAKRQAAANPTRTIASIKRRMGSDYRVSIDGREYYPQEISSLILQKVKADAEQYLGERIEKAVITVPAYFNDCQRQATREAGLIAGLDVIRIISEPTAAALAYGLADEDIHTVLVWDLGGGTFDVSILELEKGIFEVRAVNGDTWLGGDDYDERLMAYLGQQYQEIHRAAFPDNAMARQRLREAAEKAKIQLSAEASAEVYLPFISGATHLNMTISREKFQELTFDLLQKMIPPTRQALADAELRPQDIDRVLLVGGATRMPAVRKLALGLFGQVPYQSINPDEVVALGAAVQAGMLLGTVDKAVLLDVLPLSLGVETQGGLFTRLIRRNTPLPASEAHVFTTAKDGQTAVDIRVWQGERELASDNILLGEFELPGIPPLPRGTAKIEVTFEVDVDGIVHISATDLLTEAARSVKFASSKRLSPEEIRKRIDEAEANAGEDMNRREQVQAGIEADSTLAAAEMLVETSGNRELANRIWKAVLKVKEALASGQLETIKNESAELRKLLKTVQGEVVTVKKQAVSLLSREPQ